MSVTLKPTQRLRKCVSSILSLRVTWRKVSRHLVKEVLQRARQSMRKGKIVLESERKPKSQSERHRGREKCRVLAANTKMHATQ